MINNIKNLFRYRTLIAALVGRHLSIRYRGSVLGFLWTLLNPLCLMLVYMLVFKYYIRFDDQEHYSIFLFTGLLPWLWVQSSLIEGAASITSSGHLITKSLFPADVLPAVAVLTNLVNLLLSLPVLLVIMLVTGATLHWTILLLPLVLIMQAIFLFGVVLILAALNVHFRDVQHILGNLLTFVFFLCPILYPLKVVPERFQFTLHMNPLASFTVSYHRLILEGQLPELWTMGYIVGATVVALAVGNRVFEHYRETFAELL